MCGRRLMSRWKLASGQERLVLCGVSVRLLRYEKAQTYDMMAWAMHQILTMVLAKITSF